MPKSAGKHPHKKTYKKHDAEESETHIDPITESVKSAQADRADEDVIEVQATAVNEEPEEIHSESTTESENERETRVEFPYSDVVRTYAPKAMDMADKVADDWKKDGSFMNLGIENPYANMAVSLGLKKAKELEKKLDEKGVLSAVRMGVEVIKQQVNKRK